MQSGWIWAPALFSISFLLLPLLPTEQGVTVAGMEPPPSTQAAAVTLMP